MKPRVLVVDDSSFVRATVSRALEADGVDVVGLARDGEEAVEKNLDLSPDVIVLDLQMPRVDGVEAIRRIHATRPVPVLVFASMDAAGAELAVEALSEGAVDVLPKPTRGALASDLAPRVWALAPMSRPAPRIGRLPPPAPRGGRAPRLVVIAASTGGPPCVEQIVRALPADFPAATVVAQHMPSGFTASYARRLDRLAHVRVFEGAHGDTVGPGEVCILPGGTVGTVHAASEGARHFRVHVNADATLPGARPSASALFFSALGAAGATVRAIVLTGMGGDGSDAVPPLVAAGALVTAQDPSEAVISSMPSSAIAAGAQSVESVAQMADSFRAIARAAREASR